MDIDEWMPLYHKIAKDLSLSQSEDLEASKILSSMLSGNKMIDPSYKVLKKIKSLISGKTCEIFGTSSKLEDLVKENLKEIMRWKENSERILIAADGATSTLWRSGIIPDIIVTDLDGGLEDQLNSLKNGSIVIVLAHGDNIEKIKNAIPRMKGPVLGSTQVDPPPEYDLFNFGGFTDGDRAVLLADEMGASNIELIGFDLEDPASKIEDGGIRSILTKRDKDRKRKKLSWARNILEVSNIEIIFK